MAVLLVAAAAMILLGAAVPHTHAGAAGLYNQEHDLTLYAVSVGAALVEPVPTFFVDLVLAAVSFVVVPRAPSRACAHADCRAPPSA